MSDKRKKINKKLINKNLKILGHPKVQIVSEVCCNFSVFSLFIAKEENSQKLWTELIGDSLRTILLNIFFLPY